MKILEHNVEANEVIEREATAAEIAQSKEDAKKATSERAAAEAKAEARAALLERLGMTEDEAKLLLA